MKTIYPNFKNQSAILNIVRQIDNERLEIIENNKTQIDKFEEGCGVSLLKWEEYNDWDFSILTHDFFDPVYEFKEYENSYTFWCGGFEYAVNKNGEAMFYKLNNKK